MLTFIGTIILGFITIYQNYKAQEKTDEVNRLQLELQKKSMAMAEQNYKSEKLYEDKKNTPKFEITNYCMNGRYSNLCVILKNISNDIVSGIKTISFEVFDNSESIIVTSNKVRSKKFSLSQNEETQIEFHNSEIISSEVNIVWSFKCDDSNGKTYYYKANLYVDNIDTYSRELWKLERVG